MVVKKILKAVILLLAVLFVVLQGFEYELEGDAISAIGLFFLTILYCRWVSVKSKLFFSFLIAFTAAQILVLSSWFSPQIEEGDFDFYYYGANLLYIISYILLMIRILKELNFKKIFSELAIPIFVLVILDVFCVVLVTDTASSVLTFEEYILEFSYNAVIMLLLSIALINYMFRNDNKSMMILVGSLCIVFSEIIQMTYYYILEDSSLVFIYSLFLVIAFFFFYMQSRHVFTGPEPEYVEEHLEEA